MLAEQTSVVQNNTVENFLSGYDKQVIKNGMALRKVLLKNLPNIIEQLDLPSKMIAYCYGQKYSDLICTIIPSKKGLKLGFNRGVELQDKEHDLRGAGKISRYVVITTLEQIKSHALKNLLANALMLYNKRIE